MGGDIAARKRERGTARATAIAEALMTARSFVSLTALCLLSLTGCLPSGPRLAIVAATDLTAYEEVDEIEVELLGVGLSETLEIDRGQDLAEGVTVFDRRLGAYDGREVRITLRRDGEDVLHRDLVFDHRQDRELFVLIPRECGDVDCFEDDGETCIRGTCAPSTCVVGDEAECPEATCATDGECAADATCARAECRDGACLALGDDASCEGDAWCDPRSGCAPRRRRTRDAGTDAAPTDAGTDAPDAGTEDAGQDASTDDAGLGV